jgi:glutamate-1-semialdehyde 2,1-aminomutase
MPFGMEHQSWNDRWKTSRELLNRSRQALAGGVSSPFRGKSPVPLFFKEGWGCRLKDVDENVYIDYALGWGPNILGYRHPGIVDAMKKVVEGPHTYGAQHQLEYRVAERLQSIVPCAQRVAFTSSGSEAVQLALRLARAFTRREKILKFEGHYHGWMDSTLLSYKPALQEAGPFSSPNAVLGSRGQVRNAAENVRVVPWNQVDLAQQALEREGSSIAAVILEPVLCNGGCLLPLPGYLQSLKNLCEKHGALLIFDEIITGFRLALRGAQSHYAVTPDLATFGKAIGGGLPLSLVAGRQEVMELMFGGGVVFGGTFNGNPVSLAAAEATLEVLSQNNGAPLVQANQAGQALMDGITELGHRHGLPLLTTGFGTAFAIHFTNRTQLIDYRDTLDDNRELLVRFLLEALAEGIHLLPDGRFYTSIVHSGEDIVQTLNAFDRALKRLAG